MLTTPWMCAYADYTHSELLAEHSSSSTSTRVAARDCQSPEPPAERRPLIAHASAEPSRAASGKGAVQRSGPKRPRVDKSAQTRPLPGASMVAC